MIKLADEHKKILHLSSHDHVTYSALELEYN